MLLNTDMKSLRPRNSQTEKVDTGSFGLSLLNKNIAQLVNGLSRNITRPGRTIYIYRKHSVSTSTNIERINSRESICGWLWYTTGPYKL
jgi:hypothetical protein